MVYTELGAARRQVLHQRALARLETAGARASELAYHALLAGEDAAPIVTVCRPGMRRWPSLPSRRPSGTTNRRAPCSRIPAAADYATGLGGRPPLRLPGAVVYLPACLGSGPGTYEELVAYAQQKPLPALVSITLTRLAILALQQSHDRSKVRALLEEAWRMAETSHDQKALAETECNLAQIIGVVWEDPKGALPHGEQALSLARGIHDQELEARSLFCLEDPYSWGRLCGGHALF